jgi:hypothetical protein
MKHYLKKIISIIPIIISLILIYFIGIGVYQSEIGLIDSVQYWTGIKLLISGSNSYNSESVINLQKNLHIEHYPILLWNPPFILTLFSWMSFFSFRVAAFIWLVISIILVIKSVEILKAKYPIQLLVNKVLVYLFIATFYPFFLMLYYGQISSINLIAVTFFLVYATNKNFSYRKGTILSLTLIKPHHFLLIYVWFFIESLSIKNYKIIISFIASLIILLLFPLYYNQNILFDYFNAWYASPHYWKTPTLGSWLQEFTGINSFYTRVLPQLVITFILVIFGIIKKFRLDTEKNILLILSVSMCITSYGWVYDYVVLLPVCWYILYMYRLLPKLIIISANILLLIFANNYGQEWMLWYPYLILIGYIVANSNYHPSANKLIR